MACPTCNRSAAHPFRVYDEFGKAVMGCVDEYHSGHLLRGTESARWHARPAAKKVRAAMLRYRRAIAADIVRGSML